VDARTGAGRIKADFLWEEQKLIVQLDRRRYRSTEQADNEDRVLEALGYRVLHITERELTTEPDRIAELLRRELENRTSALQ
jgi:very-short-patch-repair endonuclease